MAANLSTTKTKSPVPPKKSGLLNYTTQIEASQSVGEIQEMLRMGGAKRIALEFDSNNQPSGLAFQILAGEIPLLFSLPANIEGVHAVLQERREKNPKIWIAYATREQAERVAWRILKDWIEAQLAIVECGLAQLEQVMLPYMLVAPEQTLYEEMKSHDFVLPEVAATSRMLTAKK